MIDNLEQLEIAKSNQSFLTSFFETLKGLDRHLRFIFVTGTSRFSLASLFSGFDHLNDITLNHKYAHLLGYTEEEISLFFKPHLAKLEKKQRKTAQELAELMRIWYSGYRFCKEKATIYNPFSTLLFLENGEVDNYWAQATTPTFLINQIKKQSYPLDQISGIQVGDTIFNCHDLDSSSLISLMWQMGYLTIKNYDPVSHLHCLDYPNQEVKRSFPLF